MNRYTSYHKAALGIGTPDELSIIKQVFEFEPQLVLMADGISATIPVGAAVERMAALANANVPPAKDTAFETLLDYLYDLKQRDIAWLVLDARGR